jgi:hypothetical protein
MASKLTGADISEITRQSDVTSKPVRDNFTNLKNKTNELVDEIAAAAIGTTNAETTAARPYHTNLKERLDSIWDGKQNYVKNGGAVTEQGTPDMTVAVAAGEAKISGIDAKWAAANSATITVPGSNTRLDIVVAQSDSTLTVVTGVAAASPVFPSVSSTQVVLAVLVVKNTTTSLNEGTEIFTVKNFENPYFPNLYINTAYTATNKKHNNVIVDSTAAITGTLECQGFCHIANYNNAGADGSGEAVVGTNITGKYNTGTQWTLVNAATDGTPGGVGSTLTGSGGAGVTNQSYKPYLGNAGVSAGNLIIKAFSIYIKDIDLTGGNGAAGVTELDPGGIFPAGNFGVGASGRDGQNGGGVTLTAISEIEILTGGTLDLSGGTGGNGGSASGGSVGNLGGDGGDGGNGGSLTYTSKTFTNNGTLTQASGSVGTGGTGSGGSDSNSNGAAGTAGTPGSTSATLYNFTDGLPSGYADWVHALYTGYAV